MRPPPTLPESLAATLDLPGGGPGSRRTIEPFWGMREGNKHRVFGGYAAALALAAAARAAGQPALLSCYVMFLGPTRLGDVDVEVSVLRSGHATSAVRAATSQRGEPCVSVEAWFASLDALERPHTDGHAVPPPSACPPAADWSQEFPFMRAFEERAIDYPRAIDEFPGGPPFVELWMRPALALGGSAPILAQLFDVIALDAHLLDAVVRAGPYLSTAMWSLDLAVWWYATRSDAAGWFRMTGSSTPPSGGIAATTGAILAPDGSPVARAAQQGRVYDPRQTGGPGPAL